MISEWVARLCSYWLGLVYSEQWTGKMPQCTVYGESDYLDQRTEPVRQIPPERGGNGEWGAQRLQLRAASFTVVQTVQTPKGRKPLGHWPSPLDQPPDLAQRPCEGKQKRPFIFTTLLFLHVNPSVLIVLC